MYINISLSSGKYVLVLKVAQGALNVACFCGLSEVQECSSSLYMVYISPTQAAVKHHMICW